MRAKLGKRFTIESLPKEVREKIEDITFEDDLVDGIGLVNLKDQYVFYDDYSHIMVFSSKSDLIHLIKEEVIQRR